MTPLRLRYVQAWVDREGRAHHYFRRSGYQRVSLPGLPGSLEFMQAYQRALANEREPVGAKRNKPGSVSAVVAAYLDSALHFASRAKGTQAMHRTILERFREQFGAYPIASMPARFISTVLAKKRPYAAKNWLRAIRGLCQYAIGQGWLKDDPTAGIKLKAPKSTGGHHTWTDEEIAQFEASHHVASKARLALALLLYTVQRRGDVIRMGRQHVRNGVLTITQQKTGVTLSIPVRAELKAILDATSGGHLTFLVTRTGRPYSGTDFSEQFRAWCQEARLPKRCVVHGLRKAGCRRLAEAGCSANEIAAWSGHASLREVERYTKAADQQRLARNALARTMNAAKTKVSNSGEV
jgi:integrase